MADTRAEDSWEAVPVGGVLKLRKEQGDDEPAAQLALFEFKEDRRLASQASADGRYRQPTPFKID